jgi:hypothetical protein
MCVCGGGGGASASVVPVRADQCLWLACTGATTGIRRPTRCTPHSQAFVSHPRCVCRENARASCSSLSGPVPVAAGQSEVGVETVECSLDLWPLLILRCAGMVIPENCNRSSAEAHWGSHRGQLMVDAEQRPGRRTPHCGPGWLPRAVARSRGSCQAEEPPSKRTHPHPQHNEARTAAQIINLTQHSARGWDRRWPNAQRPPPCCVSHAPHATSVRRPPCGPCSQRHPSRSDAARLPPPVSRPHTHTHTHTRTHIHTAQC